MLLSHGKVMISNGLMIPKRWPRGKKLPECAESEQKEKQSLGGESRKSFFFLFFCAIISSCVASYISKLVAGVLVMGIDG